MAETKWIEVRKELYKQVRNHVRVHLGEESAGFSSYQKDYENEFAKAWKPADRTELISAAGVAKFLFLGDFHALQQSQKAQLRVLNALPKRQKVTLALECFEASHQKFINQFMDGKISEKDFLKAIGWSKNWGFPWDHYKPLVRWAQRRKIPVLGLNLKDQTQGVASLNRRDKFAAELLWRENQKNQDHQIVVVYGDLHLSKNHLPQFLKKRFPKGLFEKISVFIFQNSEKIYFELLQNELELQTDVVRLAKNKYCLMSVPPWVKWQNYLLFLEHYDSGFDDDLDFTDYVAGYVKILCEDLSLKFVEGSFSIYSAADDHFWKLLSKKFSKKTELDWFKNLIKDGESFYVPELSCGYLARASVNHAASLAMLIVFSEMGAFVKNPIQMPNEFLQLIWLKAVEYLGSKFINPKRKTETLADVKLALSARSPSDRGKEALQLTLSQKMHELLFLAGGDRHKDIFKAKQTASYRESATLLGGILGEKMFTAYRKRLISKASLVALLRKPLSSVQFREMYYEIIEVVESFPEPFQSKADKM